MAFFRYTVKNEHGDTVKGKVEARNKEQAAALLRERSLFVVDVKPQEQTSFAGIQAMMSGMNEDDIVNFTRQLATMINAGLALTDGLSILEQQSEKPAMTKVISDTLREIEGGSSFSVALEKQGVFPEVYVQLVKAGETGGVLDEIMQRLADNMEKSKEFKAKTKGALIYPIIVVLAMLAVATIMMIFVVPKLTEMYQDFGADLPLPTQILIGISNATVSYWWVVLAAMVGGFFGLRAYKATPVGARAVDDWLFKVPVFGVLRKKIIITEFARTMSLLLGAGISLLQALEVNAKAMDSVLYEDATGRAAQKVEKGVALSQALQAESVFPIILYQMVAVGEETGRLDEVLLKLSSYYESESEHSIKNLTTALEPMIMIVLAVGVGLIVVAIIMPIYNLTSQF